MSEGERRRGESERAMRSFRTLLRRCGATLCKSQHRRAAPLFSRRVFRARRDIDYREKRESPRPGPVCTAISAARVSSTVSNRAVFFEVSKELSSLRQITSARTPSRADFAAAERYREGVVGQRGGRWVLGNGSGKIEGEGNYLIYLFFTQTRCLVSQRSEFCSVHLDSLKLREQSNHGRQH